MRRRHPALRACVVTPAARGNPKSGLLAAAVREARHDLLLLTDDNVASSPARIQDHLAYRQAGYGLVAAAALGEGSANFWAAVDEAFMNGRFARLQLAGDAIGLAFTTGKSILVSRAALAASGGYEAAGDTLCEDAIVQQRLAAIGTRAAISDATVRQPLGRRRFREVWHRHLRWTGCRKRHVPLLFVVELVTSAPVAAIAGGLAAASLGLGAVAGIVGTMMLLMLLEWAFLVLARWPLDRRFPLAWLVREALSLALWFVALVPRRRLVWRDQTFVAGAGVHPNRRASRRTD
jgi:ceramide glucosyltransferase